LIEASVVGLGTWVLGGGSAWGEDPDDQEWNPWFKLENGRIILNLLEGWSDLTAKYECTLAQLAIAWTVAQPGITCALCGARRPAQALGNAKGGCDRYGTG
jgi:aryl-alcohol dehydrogenase-like predicted oxidoreductase